MTAWTYLALRDERLIGAGATVEDARRLCEDKALEMHEAPLVDWTVPEREDASATCEYVGGEREFRRGVYAIRRVPVARFGERE